MAKHLYGKSWKEKSWACRLGFHSWFYHFTLDFVGEECNYCFKRVRK